MASMCF
jgi:drug/metabolite transporter (DMT)-like permease